MLNFVARMTTTHTLLHTPQDTDHLLQLLGNLLQQAIPQPAAQSIQHSLIPEATAALQAGHWHIELVPYDATLSYHQHAYLAGLRFVQSELRQAIVVIDALQGAYPLASRPSESYRALHYQLTDIHDPSFAEKALHCVVLQSV